MSLLFCAGLGRSLFSKPSVLVIADNSKNVASGVNISKEDNFNLDSGIEKGGAEGPKNAY